MSVTSEGREELLKRCAIVDKAVRSNIDLIPINNWHFDDETLDKLREQKHKSVEEQLTVEQMEKLSKVSKQRLAREMGVSCRTVTDVLDWLARNHVNTKPITPKAAPQTVSLRKRSKEMKIKDDKIDDSKALNTEDVIKLDRSTSGESPAKPTTDVSCKRTEKQKRKYDSLAVAGGSAIVPADALEGRKLALQKLQEKLEQFKAKRRGKMTAHQFEEKRKLKRRMSKLKMKERKSTVKQQQKDSKLLSDNATPAKRLKVDTQIKLDGNKQKAEKLIFSKFDFIVRDEKKKETKKDKRDKFVGKDYKRLLEKAEKREERLEKIREKNPDKAFRIEQNIQWNKALSRAEGRKVKDNQELLQKSLQKKLKIKEWRKKKWEKRVEHTEQVKARRQEKRLSNIKARKDAVRKKKLKKARKKGRIL